MEYCIECMKQDIWRSGQGHHIVSRKIAKYMEHVPMNVTPLCIYHHTASPTGIHHNKEMMLRYKQELQLKFTLMFIKEFYEHKEIKQLLDCSDNTVKAITKTVPRTKEGYDAKKIIFHMMGDRNYFDFNEEEVKEVI